MTGTMAPIRWQGLTNAPTADWMSLWPINVAYGPLCACVAAPRESKLWVLPPFTPYHPAPSSHPTQPLASVSYTDIRKEWQKYHEIQP